MKHLAEVAGLSELVRVETGALGAHACYIYARGEFKYPSSVLDAAIAEVARTVDPSDSAVIAHLAGSLGLDVLAPHRRVAALHPLVSLPSSDGAGLDLSRLAVLCAVVLALIAWAASAIHHRIAAARSIE